MADDKKTNKSINGKNELDVFLVKIYRVIPKNCALIIENRFSGKKVKVVSNDMNKKSGRKGYAIVWPWKRAKLISVAKKTLDYEAMEFDDSEGQAVFVDFAVVVKIVSPYKYEYEHKDPEGQLKKMLRSEMRVLIEKASWAEMVGKRFKITTNEKIETHINPQFDQELIELRRKLDDFAMEYGLLVTELLCKDIQQSKEMQKAYDAKARKEREAEAEIAEAKRRLEKEQIEADIVKVKANAQAEAEAISVGKYFKAVKESLDEFNLPAEKKAEILVQIQNSYMLTHGNTNNANLFAFMGNHESMKTGAVAGATTSAMQKEKEEKAEKGKKPKQKK